MHRKYIRASSSVKRPENIKHIIQGFRETFSKLHKNCCENIVYLSITNRSYVFYQDCTQYTSRNFMLIFQSFHQQILHRTLHKLQLAIIHNVLYFSPV